MQTDSELDQDLIILLDFEPEIPCEGTNHSSGLIGHDPNAPGAYMVSSPCCGPKVIQCAPRVANMRTNLELYCGLCSHTHPITDYRFIPLDTL